MGWRDNLQLEGKGSFRGIEFYVDSSTAEVGRRSVIYSYPGRDDIGTEDLGRRARRFPLEAFVLGDNYMKERDELRKAFETAGPGPLVHPYWGNLNAIVDGPVRIQESPSRGGMAKFSLTLVEVGDTLSPTVAPDTQETVDDACDEATVAAADQLNEDFDVVGYIAAVVHAATNLVNAVASDLNKIKGYVNAAMAAVDAIGAAIDAVTDAVASLILLPGQLASALQGVVNDIMDSIASIGDAWDSYFDDDETPGDVAGTPATAAVGSTVASGDARVELAMRAFRELSVFGDDLDDVDEVTEQREQEADNQAAFIAFIKATAVIEACRSISQLPFTSASKAEEVRDELCDYLESLAETAGDLSYGPLVDLRTAISEHLSQVADELPQLVTYTPATVLPALVIAQLLYGDGSRDIEIINRNDLENPCRVSGGVEIEVLSDA